MKNVIGACYSYFGTLIGEGPSILFGQGVASRSKVPCGGWAMVTQKPISNVAYFTDLMSSQASRFAISCWYLACFLDFASLRFLKLLAGMVSSTIETSAPEMITRSGLSEDVDRLTGIGAGGLLLARRPGRSAYSFWEGPRVG